MMTTTTPTVSLTFGTAWAVARSQMIAHLPLLGVAALWFGYPSDHWGVRLALILVTTYGLFCWSSRFHETAHQTLPRFPESMSVLSGRMIGTVLMVPYHCYRESHIRHHAYLNRPNDWELWPYSDPNASLGFRRVFVWFDLLLGIFAAPIVYGRIYLQSDSPIKPDVLRKIFFEYLAIVLFWGLTLGLIAHYGTWKEFAIAWLIPHMMAGFMQVGRKLTEHLGMASFDPMQGTRTVVGKTWFTRICSTLNFDIFVHGPHHRYPRVTHDKLKGRMNVHIESNPEIKFPLFASYSGAVLNMLPFLWKNPGVGLNAGATFANKVNIDDVSNFFEDARDIVEGGWEDEAPTAPNAQTVGNLADPIPELMTTFQVEQ